MDTRRVERAKKLATKSDEDCWTLARLAWEAIDKDGEPAGEWCAAVGMTRRSVERMRATHAMYHGPDATRAPHEGRSFWEHVELAGMGDAEAEKLLAEAEANSESVRTARQRRERTAADDVAVLERALRAIGRTVLDIRKRTLSEEEHAQLLDEASRLETELAVLMLYLRPHVPSRAQAAPAPLEGAPA